MNLITQIIKKTEECIVQAETYYSATLARPRIDFSLTGTTAGQWCPADKKLRYNKKLAFENQDEFLNQTIPHEVAHLVVSQLFWKAGSKPHGSEWRGVMIKCFKIPARRCHSYDITSVKRKTREYLYSCNCPKEHMVGLRKHNRIAANAAQYLCTRCLCILKFKGKVNQLIPLKKKIGMLNEEIID